MKNDAKIAAINEVLEALRKLKTILDDDKLLTEKDKSKELPQLITRCRQASVLLKGG
jgi:hypothetical protein